MAILKGGEKLKAALAALQASANRARSVEVGFMADSTYPDGTPVAYVAAIQEFGTEHIPPRPFFRTMIAQDSPQWGKLLGNALKHTGYDAAKSLDLMGEHIEGELQQSILDTNSPPLAPSTIAAKSAGGTSAGEVGVMGPEKPLVDTGLMLKSPTHKVNM